MTSSSNNQLLAANSSSSFREAEVLVRCENVSKKFCRSLKKSLWYGLKDMVHDLNPFCSKFEISSDDSNLRDDEFFAVRNVSFELRRGECLGLIGKNGAGKTTLLKIVNGLIKPDSGRVEMRGRIGALIALGAGFNPILTGRENVYVNGAVIGLTKREIDEKIEDIIEFADIRDFIDSPVQSYSSGMQVRLGFAIATAIEPDILILDEVLAVGDMAFRNKCYNRIGRLQKNAAVIFVSHSMEQISNLTNRVLLMQKGTMHFHGNSSEGVQAYNLENASSTDEGSTFWTVEVPFKRIGFEARTFEVEYGRNLVLNFDYETFAVLPNANIRVAFYDESGQFFAEWNSSFHDKNFQFDTPSGRIGLEIGPIYFKPGRYLASLLIQERSSIFHNVWISKQLQLNVKGTSRGYAPFQIPYTSMQCHND